VAERTSVIPDSAAGFGLLRMPAEVRFGPGTALTVPAAAAALGERVLVCSDAYVATTEAFQAMVRAITSLGLRTEVIADVQPELPLAYVNSAARVARDFQPDVIVGYGGGSTLDLAKLLALLVTYPDPLSRYYGENQVPGRVTPQIAVPTTAGTGSEVTPVAVLSDPDRELKIGVSSPYLVPEIAVVDPTLTASAPPSVTAHSGIDALVHAVESFTARPRLAGQEYRDQVFVGRNQLSSMLALRATTLIAGSLRSAVRAGHEPASRAAMAEGSLLAGVAFATAGTHLSHAIQYPIGALTKTPHGLGTGMLLPYVLDACKPSITDQLAQLGAAMGLTDPAPDATIAHIRTLVADIGIPPTLADIGVTRADLPRVVELSATVTRLVGNAPVEADPALLGEIVGAAFEGRVGQPWP
jgi:alcohol dehydrogenase